MNKISRKFKISLLCLLSFTIIPSVNADYATGFATGLLVGSIGEEETKTAFYNANAARLKTTEALRLKKLKAETGNLYKVIEETYQEIEKQIQNGKLSTCIKTGVFNTETNNYLLMRNRLPKVNAFVSFFEEQGYQLSTRENNYFCLSWQQ